MISKNLPFHFADFVFEAACSFRGLDLTSNSLSAQGLHKDLHYDGGGMKIRGDNVVDSSLSLCLLVGSRTPFRPFHAHAFSFHLLAQYARGVTCTKTVSPTSGKRL